MVIPFVNLSLQYKEIKNQLWKDWKKILNSGNFLNGDYLSKFELDFAAFCQRKYAKVVASGTDALIIGLDSCGIGSGDEVILPSFTFVSTALSIIRVKAKPVFVDINPNDYNIDPQKIEEKITPKTKAILPVHLFGQLVNMDKVMKIAKNYKLKVIEDACQAHGASLNGKMAGSFGDLAAFSFYPTKNLPSFSDCGIIVTDNKKILNKIDRLTKYGFKTKYVSYEYGYNSRGDELQAAWLNASLTLLSKRNNKRQLLALRYIKKLSHLPLILPKRINGSKHIYHIFAIRTQKRNKLKDFLYKKGISTIIHYPVPVHKQPAFKEFNAIILPQTEQCINEILSLPIYPQLTLKQQDYICHSISEFYDKSF